MWREYIRAAAEDPSKRVPPGPGSFGKDSGSIFRRYSPTTWAMVGLITAGTIGYFVFYDRSRRQVDRESHRVVPGVADRDVRAK